MDSEFNEVELILGLVGKNPDVACEGKRKSGSDRMTVCGTDYRNVQTSYG